MISRPAPARCTARAHARMKDSTSCESRTSSAGRSRNARCVKSPAAARDNSWHRAPSRLCSGNLAENRGEIKYRSGGRVEGSRGTISSGLMAFGIILTNADDPAAIVKAKR